MTDPFEDDPAYIARCDEEWKDHEEELAAGGRKICPECGERKLVVKYRHTRQYGGGYDSFGKCEGCDYGYVAV